MPHTVHAATAKRRATSDIWVILSLVIVLIFFGGSGFLSYWNTHTLSRNALMVTHTHEVITSLDDLALALKDAETGQRGYLITGREQYLAPYNDALARVEEHIATVERLIADNPNQQAFISSLKIHTSRKLAELEDTINLRREHGFDAALNLVLTDRGKQEMDALRDITREMQDEEQALRNRRLAEMNETYRIAIFSGLLTAMLGMALSGIVAFLIRRNIANRRRQEWLQSGQVGVSVASTGDQRVEQIGENILTYLAEYCSAQSAAFFVRDGSTYRRVATYGLSDASRMVKEFGMNDGLLGQAAQDNKTFLLDDVPEGYLTIGSAMGASKPRHILISPTSADGAVNAVMEFGFLHSVNDRTLSLLQQVSESIAIAVRSANYRSNLQNLLEETQRQAEEMQAQSEELRVTNEELEEQSRALKESQARLEAQQAELEQTNAQLEEQAQLLATQRDDIARAKNSLQVKASELERASQYKSDFLANMSHELRTPLNSSLILAKLLADNPKGNLTDEQVKFAQTIQGAGNDLLNLINDILDLSKIEAGHMEVHAEDLAIDRLLNDMTRLFEPQAKQKNLMFITYAAPGTPPSVETDRQRIEQVLKNLLSNALKFTETGSITLAIGRTADDKISFTVTDTGIGIAEEQQQAIFEAFRQADGTISRKYGGTGLGLSISRELARLLGGTIELRSESGKGSSFILTIPEHYRPELVAPRQLPMSAPATPKVGETGTPAPAAVIPAPRHVNDDRDKLNGDSRIILIVEDDPSFAQILSELAHELNFHCLLANTAEDALITARQYLPSAVVLDVGLPDHSGLSVLDRLKRDPRTRHIPVHVVSASDHTQTAYSLGAIGYMLKPVKHEELFENLKGLERRLSQRMRRVLIVEDDATQRASMGHLLGSHDVETVGVGTAAECLEKLKDTTFDCMVLDLSLPDASGYALLETLSQEEAYAFPPVIVYTGRELSADEEQRLRRYSKSIIIKGAKSPERLLDEVTLFLHQVVADLPAEQQRMIEKARNRDDVLENRSILVVEDDVRNVYALTNIFEPRGAKVHIARNGREALDLLEKIPVDLVLMDVMMPEMDGLTATRKLRTRPEWKKLPVIMLTAKAMKDDQERCLEAGANDYMAKPLDVEKLLSLVRVWMPR